MKKAYHLIFGGFLLLSLRSDRGHLPNAFTGAILFFSMMLLIDLTVLSALIFKVFGLYSSGLKNSPVYYMVITGIAVLVQFYFFLRKGRMKTYASALTSRSQKWKTIAIVSAIAFGVLSTASMAILPWVSER